MTSKPLVRRFDPATVWAAIALPCVLGVAQLLATLALSPKLPAELATHFDSRGVPDGFMSPMGSALVSLLLVAGSAQVGWLLALKNRPLVARRLIVVINLAVAGLILGVDVAMLRAHIGVEDPSTVRLSDWSMLPGLAIGLAVGLLLARLLKDHGAAEAPALGAGDLPPEGLPRGPATGLTTVTCGKAMKAFILVWVLGAVAILCVKPVMGGIFLACAPLFLVGYRSGLDVQDAQIVAFIGIGPLKVRQTIALASVRYAEPGRYHWADGGGVGLRVGPEGRVAVAARSGEAVTIETTTNTYTVVVPDGRATAVAGDINSRLDGLRRGH